MKRLRIAELIGFQSWKADAADRGDLLVLKRRADNENKQQPDLKDQI